jgi:molybdopterin converting factor small subunit
MIIELQYFSLLRDFKGPATIEVQAGTTVAKLLDRLSADVPKFKSWNSRLLVAVGYEYVGRDHVLRDGDQLSLMPPVQGG